MSNSEETPPSVELYDFDDHTSARKRIFDGVKKEFLSVFPQAYGGVKMSVSDVDYADPEEYSIRDQKDALLKDKFLARRLRGRLDLHDDKTGELLDSRDMTLMRVPYLTERGTFVHGGNEYASIMQSRLLPGAYTRRQNNGGLETQFNVRSGTGSAFRVGFEPDSSQYRLRVQQANLHLYSLLHDLGVPDEHLAESWGRDILEANQRKYDPRVFEKAYARFVPTKLQKPDAEHADKAQAIKEALDASRIHGGAARRTLPNMFDLQKSADWAKQAARLDLEEEFVKNSSSAFSPDFTPDELTDVRNAAHGVGPRLAGMAEWPAKWLPEHDASWHAWWEQYHAGRRTDDDAKQIMRWARFKRLHGDKLAENPTPRRAFALKAWGIDPLKLIDGRSRGKLEHEMAAYKTKAEDRHEKKAFEDEDLHKLAAVLNNDFRAGLDTSALNIQEEILGFLGSRPDIDAELLYARLGESKTASFEVPDGIWWMEKLARYGAGVLFKQPNGKYLLQENGENDCDDASGVGKLRPAGGGKNKRDHNLRATILREMEEEFDIDPEEAKGKIELLGYINDGPFEDCAMFVMEDHGLKPGVYQASNSKSEKIKLVEAALDDKRYIGAHPEELRPFADSDHPGNKEASEDVDYECPHCHESFDYNDEPEVAMGTVACPHCNKFVPQDGKKHHVVMRFTRFEIHKLAKMIADPELDKAAGARDTGPGAWNFDEGIVDDPDAARIKAFADAIHKSPNPWDNNFQAEDFINTYSNRGHEAMNVKPYGAELLPWIAQARRAYGTLQPGAQFAWKSNLVRPSDAAISGIDFNAPVAKPFVEFNPDGSVKGVQESALHYLAFRHSPSAAYRQMWQEFDAPTTPHMAKLLDKYQERHPKFNAREFDSFVSRLDPEFYKRKQTIDATIGKDMRPTAGIYADFADKALGWDRALEKPKVAPQKSYLPLIATAAAGLGAAGLAYWLWQKHRKKKDKPHREKKASAKQLESVEAARRTALADLKKAKEHSDRKEYGQKSVIMNRLFREYPDDFIMDDDWTYAGITHIPSGFRVHVPRNTVPAEIATSPLTKVWQRKKSEDFKRMNLGGADILEDMAKPASDSEVWIGVDLDSTLAWRPHMVKGIPFIGKPVAAMKKRVMAWVNGGQKVKIFTARAASPGAIPPVEAWLKEHGFPALEVTNEKDSHMIALYDDRAIGVEPNTGRLLSPAHDE